MRPYVIITRPAVQANIFARLLTAIECPYELFPLMEIQPLTDSRELDSSLMSLAEFCLVAFVSPNAVDAVFSKITHWPSQVAIAVMGAGSRAALAEHGITEANTLIISPVNPDKTDSETLLEVLDVNALRSGKVLIIRGETGRELLADALRALSISVTQVAAYRRCAPELTEQKKQQLIRLLSRNNDWVVTSSEVLGTMLSFAGQIELEDGVVKMQHQHLIVPHVRIAETAKKLGFQSITQTGSGDEHLLVALQSHL
ncbi:hypothetical protein BH11PSE12_BH11PSE12_18650 [soil metagenome]